MRSVLATGGTEFAQLQLFLVLFFILSDSVIDFFAKSAGKLNVVIGDSRHKISL
jgi:hypothetical protein